LRPGIKRQQGGHIVGLDLVEVCPAYDQTGSTAILAAKILMNAIGFIFYERSLKK